MKGIHTTLVVVCIGMTITGCQKTKPSENYQKSGDDIQEFFDANRAAALNIFTVNPQTGGTFYFQNGSSLVVEPNAIQSATGAMLAENVSIRINNVITRWGMLAFNMPTETDQDLLISGGSADVKLATVSGAAVTIPSGGVTMIIPGSLTGGLDTEMSYWDGIQGTQTRDNMWIPGNIALQFDQSSYLVNIWGGGGKINIDKHPPTRAIGVVPKVYLPGEFNETNTEIFVSVDGEVASLGSLDVVVAGSNGSYWTDNATFLPQGKTCNLIVVALINGTLRAEIQPFTATSNQSITITTISATTTNALRTAVNALP